MKPVKIFVIVAVVIVIIWLAAPFFLLLFFSDTNKAGEFGDLFGSVNALFTGLAFAGLVYTIMIQRDELNFTRTQLEESSNAQTKSALALAAQLQEDQSNRQMSFALNQFDIMNKNEMFEARTEIYNMYNSIEGNTTLSPNVKLLLNYFNTIGYLLASEHLPNAPTLEMLYVQVIRIWEILGNYIIDQRKSRGIYMYHFEWLAFKCFEYWSDVHNNSKITIPNNRKIDKRSIPLSDEVANYIKENAKKRENDAKKRSTTS